MTQTEALKRIDLICGAGTIAHIEETLEFYRETIEEDRVWSSPGLEKAFCYKVVDMLENELQYRDDCDM